ncbi:Uncharacterized protein Fot_34651 [Forsythia ovata]|uniref:Uncharacterized protein n=1 Tax=Forsythia ovata TaxID=205694 RepID=A0ABD1SKB5_9LAMI
MVKSKSQSVNIELEICINSKRLKRKTSTSGNRTKKSKNSVEEDFEERETVRNTSMRYMLLGYLKRAGIKFNANSADPQSNSTGAFDGTGISRNFTGMGKRNSQLNNLSGNVQSMIPDFLNQIDKKFNSNTEEVVLDRQIVLYSPILETEDESENNDVNNYTKFEKEVQVEDNDGSHLQDFEVESQYDRKGKTVVCNKTNNESIHHNAIEFEVVLSQNMCNMLNFSHSFDLGIDMETNAPDIELDDMEFTDHDLKMIDETIYMRNMSTSKKA